MLKLSTAALLLICLIGGLLLCGCEGSDGELILPPELVGIWGAAAFTSQGLPDGGGLFNVEANGDIVVESTDLASQASRVPVVVGHVFSVDGGFQVQVADPDEGTLTAVGDLDTDGTGSGNWNRGAQQGSFQLWKADPTQVNILTVAIAGSHSGTGDVTVSEGVLRGTITIDGVGTAQIGGVVTSTGHIVGGWGSDDNLPFVFFEGDDVDGTISGTWTTEDGETGTWTAAFA